MRVEVTVAVVADEGDEAIDFEAAAYAMWHAMHAADEAPETARFVEAMGLDCEVES